MIHNPPHTHAPPRPKGKSRIYTIEEFPKEFRKNWVSTLDTRYLFILATNFIITTTSVLVMQHYFGNQSITSGVRAYHDNYAQLIIETDAKETEKPDIIATKDIDTHLYNIPMSSEKSDDSSTDQVVRTPETQPQTQIIENKKAILADGRPHKYNPPTSQSAQVNQQAADEKLSLLQIIESGNEGSDPLLSELKSLDSHSSEQLIASLSAIIKASNGSNGRSNRNKSGEGYEIKGGHITEASYKTILDGMPEKQQIAYQNVTRGNTDMEAITESELIENPNSINKRLARTPEQVTAVIVSHNQSIQDCYKQILKKNPAINGKIMLRFSVTPEGTIGNVEIINSTLNDVFLEKCIVRRVKRWNDFGACNPIVGDVFYRQTYVFGY
ncbi:AgmX/PglI C-terminal domain-containing protein [candidate division KSB1 bacterium]|nr:AgmX/PglI C-terminal domain-containing protein [candidate division KSB1 bacterium]